jgi:hypothetical protein
MRTSFSPTATLAAAKGCELEEEERRVLTSVDC